MRSTGLALVGLALSMATPAALAAPAMTAADYVRRAGASDAYEIRSSRLMLTTSKNQIVVRFADRIIADSRRSSAEVRAAARSDKVPTETRLDDGGRRMLAQLKAAAGAERERLYLEQQLAAHRQALVLHRDYAESGTSRTLAVIAGRIAPVVQRHMDMLYQLRSAG